ncbi:MAG: M16 family metallopeptidase [Verrucomicrobiia bacterium]|jgi:zinc protease
MTAPVTAMPREIPALPPGVTKTTLANGLTVIVREDHGAPVVSAQAWCMTGSVHEGELLGAGLSHCLEHMLFKGTSTRGAGRIDQEVQEAGGYMNAYTSFDRTVYWIDAPNTGTSVIIDILCDIMQHASIPEEELIKEKQVILREMDMNQDDPSRRASRRLFETAYTRSSYRFTVIGYPDIFKEITREQVYAYYKAKYTPQNIFIVVAGDVTTADVIGQITAAFAGAKATAQPPSLEPDEPRQSAPREVIEEAPIELGHFHYSWHIPDVRHPDMPALDVLATLLGHGRSSRLYREIRERQRLAHSSDAWTYSPGSVGLFGLSATVDADKFTPARTAMLEQIEMLKHDPIGDEELRKVVKQFVSATLASRKTMQGQAQDLGGNWIAAHDLNFSERFLAAVKQVTPADLQRVAREYLTHENRTLFALLPEGATPESQTVADVVESHPVELVHLDNGLRLLIKQDRRLPFVEIRTALNGGVLAEPSNLNGITQLMAKMLMKGTASRDADQIAAEIESIGGSIGSYGANNSLGVSVEVLSEDLLIGLEIAADVLLNPSFPTDALERERDIQLAGIRAQKDHLLQRAMIALRRDMFGSGGYGPDSAGTEESVQAIQADQLTEFHQQLVKPDNCVLAIFGDIDKDAILAAVKNVFGEWKSDGKQIPQPRLPEVPDGITRVSEELDKKQAVVAIGFQGTTFDSDDRYPLDLLQEACSDLGSRLFMRIRDELGLAYYVGAQHMPGKVPGYFVFYTGTEPTQVELVEKELLAEASKLREDGLTEVELARCKAKMVGQKKIARQDLGGYAMASALDELYGLGFDRADSDDARYEAVTLAEIKAAAKKYLTPDRFSVSIVKGIADTPTEED